MTEIEDQQSPDEPNQVVLFDFEGNQDLNQFIGGQEQIGRAHV